MSPSSIAAAALAPSPDECTRFRGTPALARLYIGAVVTTGATIVGWCVASGPYDRPWAFLGMLAASCAAALMKLTLPLPHGSSTLSVSYAIGLATLVLLGPSSAVLTAAASAVVQCTVRTRVRNPLHRVLFSAAALAITMLVTASVFAAIRDAVPPSLPALSALVPAAAVYWLVNTAIVAGAVALTGGRSVLAVWDKDFLWSAPSYFIGAIAAAFLVFVVDSRLHWLLALVAVPLYMTYRAYSTFVTQLQDGRRRVETLSAIHLATAEALALAIEAKDLTSPAHIRRIQEYAEKLGRAARLTEDEMRGLSTAALLHDIGNLAVPEEILSKPGRLTDEEFERVKAHPVIGAGILRNVPFDCPVAELILRHHEHWDGSGYPSGLSGRQIPAAARVLAVVDCYTALLSDRPHRPGMSEDEALTTLRRCAGASLDPDLVQAFLDLLPTAAVSPVPEGLPSARHELVASPPSAGAWQDIADARREARVLNDLSQALASRLDVRGLGEAIAVKITALVPATGCALFLRNDITQLLECRYRHGPAPSSMNDPAVMSSEDLHRVLEERGEPSGTLLIAPVKHQEVIVGALVLHRAIGAWEARHKTMLGRVAALAAPALHGALLFEETQDASLTDPLTDLPNRRHLRLHVEQEVSRAQRSGTPVGVLLADMDGLKRINDTHGHDAGDRVLRALGALMRSLTRSYDLCARYAGDEFVIVLAGCDAEQAERRRLEFQQAADLLLVEVSATHLVSCGISIGAATFPADGSTLEQLIATADRRMYRDKLARAQQRHPSTLEPSL